MNMSISYLNDRTVIKQWHSYISDHPQATAYHNIAWLQAVETTYQQQPVLLMAYEDGRVVGVLPLVIMKRPLMQNAICALPYCDMGHALGKDPTITQGLQGFASEYASKKGFTQLDYRNGSSMEPIPAEAMAKYNGQKITMKMPLATSSDAQMASYKSKLRSQIRKAEKNGLTIKLSHKTDLLYDFYRVFSHNMRDLGSPTHSKCWFANIMTFYQDKACMAVVYHGDIPIGAGIILMHGTLCSIPWASTVAQYNRLAPNMLLYSHLIGFAADHGMQYFDFGRSTLNEGTYKFKKQWGAVPYPLLWVDLCNPVTSSPQGTGDSAIKATLIQIWRNLPLSVTTTVGSRVRGYISL